MKREREVDAKKIMEVVDKYKLEQAKDQALDSDRKKAEQLKWRDVWDTEKQLRSLKMSVEQGLKPLEPKQFALPLAASPEKLPALNTSHHGSVRSRGASQAPSQTFAHDNVFITDEGVEEHERPPEKTRHSSRLKERVESHDYPWEKRERSREQYRNLTKQS